MTCKSFTPPFDIRFTVNTLTNRKMYHLMDAKGERVLFDVPLETLEVVKKAMNETYSISTDRSAS